MRTTIIPIGNSRGVRIPKPLLEESGLGAEVELTAIKGEIRIAAARTRETGASTALLSEGALATDWNRPEENAAWKSLQ